MQLKRKTTKAPDSSDTRGRKRTRDTITDKVKMEEEESPEPAFQLDMPQSLKDILIEDWENITKEGLVVNLPAKITVSDILNRYYSQYKESNGNNELLEQMIQGLKLYFHHLLGTTLLYRSEREQYDEASRLDKNVNDIYGAEHLLRLFVELPTLMDQANVDIETMEQMKIMFMNILIFIQDNEKDFFVKDYQANRDR